MSSAGQGSISVSQKAPAGGAPFPAGSANNGLSVDPVTGKIVLGNELTDLSDPAVLLNDRIIPTDGFFFGIGDVNAVGNQMTFVMDDANTDFQINMLGGRQLEIRRAFGSDLYFFGDADILNSGVSLQMISNGPASSRAIIGDLTKLFIDLDGSSDIYSIGDINGTVSNTRLEVNAGINEVRMIGSSPPASQGSTVFFRTYTALANGAGANVGTLNNAPIAGNPTKWISINDNGTVRRIPCW